MHRNNMLNIYFKNNAGQMGIDILLNEKKKLKKT